MFFVNDEFLDSSGTNIHEAYMQILGAIEETMLVSHQNIQVELKTRVCSILLE